MRISKQHQLTFVTSNPAKAEQLSRHLKLSVEHRKLDIPEIQSLDLFEIVEQKTRQAFQQIQSPVLVDDTSLIFEALGKLPGPLIKWFLEELDNSGLAQLLDGYDTRRAKVQVLFGYFDGNRFETFLGEMSGSIAPEPRGERGFGWDPIFIPDGHTKTWGEMNTAQQNATSVRKLALRKLQDFLQLI